MGLNLRKIKDEVVDVFSANTQADQQRRVTAGQPQISTQPSLVNRGVDVAQGAYKVATKINPVLQLGAKAYTKVPSAYEGVKKTVPGLSNPVTRFVENTVIEPITTTMSHAGQITSGNNPYTGNFKQQAGQASQDAINAASFVPIGKGVQAAKAGGKLLPRVYKGVSTGATYGAGFGAAQGASTALQQNQTLPQAARTVGKNTAMGGTLGGVLGGAAPLAGAGARAAKPAVVKAGTRINESNQALSGRVNVQDQNILRDFSDMHAGAYKPKPSDRAALIAQARQVGAKHGIDLTSGNPRDLLERTSAALDQIGQKRAVAQGGYVKVPQQAKPGNLPTNAAVTNSVNAPANGRAFGDFTDELYGLAGVDTGKRLVKPRLPGAKLYGSAQQLINKPADYLREKTANTIQKGVQSENVINRTLQGAAAPRTVFRNAGLSDKQRQILTQRTSGIESGGRATATLYKSIQSDLKKSGNPEQSYERIYRVLEHPDYLATKYGDGTKLTVNDLTATERSAFDKLVQLNKLRNDLNLETGVINAEQHAAGANGLHSPRIYDQELFDNGNQAATPGFLDRKAGTKRKDATKIDPKIIESSLKDPFQASALRTEVALQNKANLDALNSLSKEGLLLDKAPNKNFVQLEGKKYGPHEGKYIDKQIKSQFDQKDYFNSDLGQKAGDLIDAYQGSALGKADRFFKSTKTTLSPATGLGNIFSNVFAFSGASNVNPATAGFRMAQATKQLAQHSKKFNANVYRAEKAGLFAGDTGKALTGVEGEALRTGKKASLNPLKGAATIYGNTDKAYALGIFNELKARGLSDADAVLRTQRSMQNYANSGRGINLLADSPILGKPFARFTPELLRIAKNNAIYNPVGTAAKVGTVAAGANYLSNKAGETSEERAARENAVGQTQLPGTSSINKLVSGGKSTGNVSLNLPVNGSSVNIARLSGLNYPIEPGGDAKDALIRQLSPFADPTRKNVDGKTVLAPNQLVSSLAFKPAADQAVNRDFMGRQITDPNNRIVSEIGAGKSQYEDAEGKRQSPGKPQEQKNRARAALMNYVPLANEADALYNSAKGQKDYYGKERTVKEGVFRTLGLKTESNSKEAREKRVSNQNFFESKDKQVKDFLGKNKDLADSYFKFNDSARDRNTNKKSNSLVGPEKWSIVKGDASGRLFGQLQKEALDQENTDGKPVDPIYKLQDPARVKDALFVRSTAPGDNVEKEEILRATSPWYGDFEKAESKYYEDQSAWFKTLSKGKNPAGQNDRVKEYGSVEYPEQSDLVKGYYQAKAQGDQQGKDYFKANADQLSADFSGYKGAKLDYLNKKRAILGLDPISPDTYNNVTFGYEQDEAKVAKDLYYKGQGGGYGGNKSQSGGSIYKNAIDLNAGGAVAKPKVSVASSSPVTAKKRVAQKARPKASLKKGKV
jgi:hypothetical protein